MGSYPKNCLKTCNDLPRVGSLVMAPVTSVVVREVRVGLIVVGARARARGK